jgi:hypothetical protein
MIEGDLHCLIGVEYFPLQEFIQICRLSNVTQQSTRVYRFASLNS